MSGSPYTEGWPKRIPLPLEGDEGRLNEPVVLLSDAEPMREALGVIAALNPGHTLSRSIARAALNPEQGKDEERGGNALGKPITGSD